MGNRYLEDTYAPVVEEQTLTDLAVHGTIPDHLDGRYARIGPNPVGEPDPDAYHWFMGEGMVHGVRIRDGRAEWYRNRWVRSADVAAHLGEDWPGGPLHAGWDFAANTNVIQHGGRTFALVEAGPRPYELTDDLDTVGPCDFDGTLPGGYTAHPHRDPATGELHAVSYFFGSGDRVQYSVLGTDGRVRRTVDVDVQGKPMMHDFSLTERFVVLYDLPVTFDQQVATAMLPRWLQAPARTIGQRLMRNPIPEPIAARMARMASRRSRYQLPYRWNPDRPARVGVLPREGRAEDVRWFDVEPCYVFHPLNAFEDGDSIVLDVVRHPRMFATHLQGPNEGPPTLDRWTVDLNAGKVREERLHERPQEFPRVDERLTGRRHRYGYAVGVTDGAEDVVLRHDLAAGGTEVRSFGPGRMASEFVFVPTADDAPEDDGVLMGYVHDLPEGTTELAFLDAQSLETVASVHLPVRVPAGFHGNWMPAT